MGIFDPLLNFFAPRTKVPATETAGTSGTPVIGGYITSAEKHSSLIGTERYKTFAGVVQNTAIVAAGVRYFLNLVTKPTWKVQPADDSAEAQKYAELVEDIMGDMTTPWSRVIRRSAMYRFTGFSIQEWTAKKREDGVIGFMDVESRPNSTIEQWDCDTSGTVHGVVQRSPWTYEPLYLPRGRIVYCVDDALTDSPEGAGLLRHVVDYARRLGLLEKYESLGFEADLGGMPVARVPLEDMAKLQSQSKLTPTQVTELKQPFVNFINGHNKSPTRGMIVDSSTYVDNVGHPSAVRKWDVEVIRGDMEQQAPINEAINRINQEIARILGVEGLLLGADGNGSLALSRDKTNSFYLTVDSTLSELVQVFERDYLTPLWKLNGWPEELMPSFVPDAVQFRDVTEIATMLETMARAGATLQPDDEVINTVRTLSGLPLAPEIDLELMASMALAQNPPPPGGEPDGPGGDGDTGKADAKAGKAKAKGRAEKMAKVYTGDGSAVMLCVPPEVAVGLCVPHGEEPADMHITMGFLGRGLSDAAKAVVARVVEDVAATTPPIVAKIGGCGWFGSSHGSDGKDVVVAFVDSPGVTHLRQRLQVALKSAGVPIDETHGFIPHITIAYVPAGAGQSSAIAVAPMTFLIDRLTAGHGGVQASYPLAGLDSLDAE